jgi:hypothetical protein
MTVSSYWQQLVAGATNHKPQDAETMRAAIHELRARGFGDHEIAGATQLSVDYVRRILSREAQQE